MPDITRQGIVKRATLTQAEIADIKHLIAFCNAYEGSQMRIGYDMLHKREGDAENDFLYYEDGQLVGYLWCDSWGTREKELVGMVHPNYRRRGIFSTLLDTAKAAYKQAGVDHFLMICEHSSQSGQAFLAAAGAQHSHSEHEMELGMFYERGRVTEGLLMREANEDDIDAIVSLLATDTGNTADTLAWVSYLMAQPQHRFSYATLNGQPLGTQLQDYL
jgi:N-acetylglutamate synthase-like GNAT family acetyltransferase